MKSTFFSVLLAGTAQALVTRQESCCFELTAQISTTHTNASLGQLSDGQIRTGGGLPPSTFCLTSTSIGDSAGRNCIITSPETQFQCDQGASVGALGFSVGCDGLVSHDGDTTFWQCQTGDNGEANIYTTPGGTQCTEIELFASGCAPKCSAPPPTSPASSCVPNLTDNTFQYPHLIVSIDSAHPTTSNGTSYFGAITPTISTLYNFDIPQSYAGKTCSLIFLFPAQSSLQTSSFSFSGNGKLSFSELKGEFSAQTTYNTRPGVGKTYPDVTVSPGAEEEGYVIASFDCPAGETAVYEIGEGQGGNTVLKYFQDYNPSPIGLYIFPC